jgi:uncharacterized repeat protein (TIGR03803 family)
MKRTDFSFWSPLTILLAVLIFLGSAFADGARGQVLHRFQGPDGSNPEGNLIADRVGNFYGTTEYGGENGYYGTVFKLSPPAKPDCPWILETLYVFTNTGDGARPTDGLIFDNEGNLYGTTSDSNAGGYGEIFRLSPPSARGGAWTETVLYHFQGGSDGAYPRGGLIADEQRNFYGATETSIFELSPPAPAGAAWTFSVLHDFTDSMSDGWSAQDGLVRDERGNLYGSTLWGGYEGNPDCGEIGCGTVFEVSPPAAPGGEWTEQVLHFFGVGSDGFDPEGGLTLDARGNLYGTTYSGGALGGGTAFQLVRPNRAGGSWTEHVIHSFNYSPYDGAAPVATMIPDWDGNLYGTAMFGGHPCVYDDATYGCGVVFELSPPESDGGAWRERVLYFFQMRPGAGRQPGASLLFDDFGSLYGTTVYGGACAAEQCGTVFRIVP